MFLDFMNNKGTLNKTEKTTTNNQISHSLLGVLRSYYQARKHKTHTKNQQLCKK